MAAPEITYADLTSFLASNLYVTDGNPAALDEWIEKNGMTSEVLTTLGLAMTEAVTVRIFENGEQPSTAMFNVALTAFQVGWEAHKHFHGGQI